MIARVNIEPKPDPTNSVFASAKKQISNFSNVADNNIKNGLLSNPHGYGKIKVNVQGKTGEFNDTVGFLIETALKNVGCREVQFIP